MYVNSPTMKSGLLRSELFTWERERNTLLAKVNWYSRIKFSSLYPAFIVASYRGNNKFIYHLKGAIFSRSKRGYGMGCIVTKLKGM